MAISLIPLAAWQWDTYTCPLLSVSYLLRRSIIWLVALLFNKWDSKLSDKTQPTQPDMVCKNRRKDALIKSVRGPRPVQGAHRRCTGTTEVGTEVPAHAKKRGQMSDNAPAWRVTLGILSERSLAQRGLLPPYRAQKTPLRSVYAPDCAPRKYF